VNGEDILFAMTSLGFENYAEALKIYLSKYREVSITPKYRPVMFSRPVKQGSRFLTRSRSSLSLIEARIRTGRAAKVTEPLVALHRAQAPFQEPTFREKAQTPPRTVFMLPKRPITERLVNTERRLMPTAISSRLRGIVSRTGHNSCHPSRRRLTRRISCV
jgi:hypothetical protein